MEPVKYSKVRLSVFLAVVVFLLFNSGAFFRSSNPFGTLIGVMLLGISIMSLIVVPRRLFGNGNAIIAEAEGLKVSTLWATHKIRWENLSEIKPQRITMRLWGIIPIYSYSSIIFKLDSGFIGRKSMAVPTVLIERNGRSDADIIAAIAELHRRFRTVGAAAIAAQNVVTGGGHDTDGPDAAIARYMANKQQMENPVPPAAAVRTFGRKGL